MEAIIFKCKSIEENRREARCNALHVISYHIMSCLYMAGFVVISHVDCDML